jgi:uncharacterized protein YhaN
METMERNRQEFLSVLNDLLAARAQPSATHTDLSVRLAQFLESTRKEDDVRRHRQQARELWMNASKERREAEDALLHKARAHQQAIERHEQIAAAWREWLDRNTLPSHLSPAMGRDFLEALKRSRVTLGRIHEVDQQLRRGADQELNFVGRLNAILAPTGRASSADPITDLETLGTTLQSAEDHAQHVAILDARIGQMDNQLGTLRTELEEACQQIAQLRRLESEADLDAIRQDLTRQLEEQETHLSGDQGRLSELRSQRQAMATDVRLSQLHEQKEARVEEIRQATREWAVLALARRMFDDARKRYEEQRQPAVVRRASTYLSHLTGNRYREARIPLDGSDLQIRPTGDAPLKTINQLSRGTAEQLYLALRFGFIEEFTRDRSSLPIVMDDILVNFDPERATASVEALIRFSERFQVLYFTCHPETADRFRTIAPSIPVFELSDGRFTELTRTSRAGTMLF